MPSIGAHMVVGHLVGEKLNIETDDFIRGNLLPDIIDSKDSHHKIKGSIYLIPDINYWLNNLDFTNDLYIGYLVHLLLDKHYLEDYLGNLYPNQNVFIDGLIYKDYDYINNKLVTDIGLDINKLVKILSNFNCIFSKEKLQYNIECLSQYTPGITRYIDYESFITFLKEISNVISKELYSYANKHKELSLRIR